jgi:hypothetical protein
MHAVCWALLGASSVTRDQAGAFCPNFRCVQPVRPSLFEEFLYRDHVGLKAPYTINLTLSDWNLTVCWKILQFSMLRKPQS